MPLTYLRRNLLCLSLLIASFPSLGQTTGYHDATSPEGALGMLKVTLACEAVMRQRCTSMFPEKTGAIDAELAKWKASEAKNIARMEARWPALLAQEPRMPSILANAAQAADKQVDGWLEEAGENGPARFAKFCDGHFVELSSGIWRRRTPKAYAYMDAMP